MSTAMNNLTEGQVDLFAGRLFDAAQSATPVVMLSAEAPNLDFADGYRIQRALMERHKLAGETLVGMKMGLTSRAKMEQMGVHEPIYGHLTSAMQRADGEHIVHKEHCHPRVEPEVAFILGRELKGPVTPAQAMLAVDGVCAALEVIDSRYKDFKFTLPDVVADNASSTRFFLGSTVRWPEELANSDYDLGNLGMVMSINGKPTQIGSSAAILEHPARSLATLANMLAPLGESLKPGWVVLAGGATAAVAVSPGDRVELAVDGLGSCTLHVT